MLVRMRMSTRGHQLLLWFCRCSNLEPQGVGQSGKDLGLGDMLFLKFKIQHLLDINNSLAPHPFGEKLAIYLNLCRETSEDAMYRSRESISKEIEFFQHGIHDVNVSKETTNPSMLSLIKPLTQLCPELPNTDWVPSLRTLNLLPQLCPELPNTDWVPSLKKSSRDGFQLISLNIFIFVFLLY